MFVLGTHAIYIIIVFAVIVQSYITLLQPGLSHAKSNGTCRCSAVRRYCLIKSPVAWCRAGWACAMHVDFMPKCHRIPLTRSVFMFGTIEDTSNIIQTGCKREVEDKGAGRGRGEKNWGNGTAGKRGKLRTCCSKKGGRRQGGGMRDAYSLSTPSSVP